jgi:hypothetical protein
MLPNWKKEIILNIKEQVKNGKKLSFVHIPKCGGCYASQYINACNIINKGHNLANNDNEVTFTIIRDPIKRFESLLNYRLSEKKPRIDFPRRLYYTHFNKSISLNEIISKFTFQDTLRLFPYRTITYWSQNVDLLITIEELEETLQLLGFTVDNSNFENKNVSPKERGALNNESIQKITAFYKKDVELYKLWTRSN